MNEKRLLQAVVAIACLVPLSVGGWSIVYGPWFLGHPPVVPRDLDSQFRYVSGIFFAMGLAYVTCIPAIETKGPRFRLLGSFCIVGGLARIGSIAMVGVPGAGHVFGLFMELGVVPLLMLWQAGLAKRMALAAVAPRKPALSIVPSARPAANDDRRLAVEAV